jgi:hypothetical protein
MMYFLTSNGIAIGSSYGTVEEAVAARDEMLAEGYVCQIEAVSLVSAYGASHDPKMFSNPAAPRQPSKAPKVGRRYRLLRR